MTAPTDINGAALAVNDFPLLMHARVVGIEDQTGVTVRIQLPDGNEFVVTANMLESLGSSVSDLIAAAIGAAMVGFVPSTRLVSTNAPLTGGGDLSADRTLDIDDFTGDSGAGGANGAVPAPAAGDAAAGKFLKANGTWAVPPAGGGGGIPLDDVIALQALAL